MRSSFSSSESISLYAGIPLPPSSTLARTLGSVGFLPLFILSRLNRPFNPGPIFFSVLSELWQTLHC